MFEKKTARIELRVKPSLKKETVRCAEVVEAPSETAYIEKAIRNRNKRVRESARKKVSK